MRAGVWNRGGAVEMWIMDVEELEFLRLEGSIRCLNGMC